MMALGDIFRIQSAEFINLVIPKNTVQHIATIASVNRELNSILMHSTHGKKVWLEIASKITGYNAAQFICHTTTTDELFFYHVKLLICPWISLPTTLPFEIPPVEGINLQLDIAITSRNRLALRIVDDDAHENVTGIYSMPCRPCDPSLFGIQCTRLPEDYPLPMPESPPFLTNTLAVDYFALDLYTTKSTQSYRVHDGVFAVMEFYETDSACDADEFNGIYFFTSETPQRMLRHMQPAPFLSHKETDVCFLPMEMWLLAHHYIWYYGPTNTTTASQLSLAGPGKRIDPALWMAYMGRGGEAVEYIHDHSIDINTPSLSQNRTLLHHAAMGGDVQTIKTLMAAGADVNARDSHNQCALCTASRWLQADAVKEFLRVGAAVHALVFDVFGYANDDGYYEESAVCGTIRAFIDNNVRGLHMLFFNGSVVHFPSAVRMLIEAGVPTNKTSTGGHFALHFFLQCVDSRVDAVPTISMFKDEDFRTEFNGLTPLSIATHRELNANVIGHIKGRIA